MSVNFAKKIIGKLLDNLPNAIYYLSSVITEEFSRIKESIMQSRLDEFKFIEKIANVYEIFPKNQDGSTNLELQNTSAYFLHERAGYLEEKLCE